MPEPAGESRVGQTLVSGHTLRSEGAAFDGNGYRVFSRGTGGSGRAKCSCGEMSAPLDSANQRKQWHREHKEANRG